MVNFIFFNDVIFILIYLLLIINGDYLIGVFFVSLNDLVVIVIGLIGSNSFKIVDEEVFCDIIIFYWLVVIKLGLGGDVYVDIVDLFIGIIYFFWGLK